MASPIAVRGRPGVDATARRKDSGSLHAVDARRSDGVVAATVGATIDTTPPHAIEQTLPLGRPTPSKKRRFGHRSKPWARAPRAPGARGDIENTKAIFSGDSEKVTVRPVDSPSLGASTSSSFDGALTAFSAAGARRPVAAAQNASSSTAPVTTSSLWRFCVGLRPFGVTSPFS